MPLVRIDHSDARTNPTEIATAIHDAIVSVVNLGVVASAVARVWIVLNPEKLTTWR